MIGKFLQAKKEKNLNYFIESRAALNLNFSTHICL